MKKQLLSGIFFIFLFCIKASLLAQDKGEVYNYEELSSFFSKMATAFQNETSDTLTLLTSRFIPEKGMVNKYKRYYNIVHGSTQKAIFTNFKGTENILYDSVNRKYYNHLKSGMILNPENKFLGWHPYWQDVGCASYPYKLLSTISFYAYDIQERTGAYNNEEAIKSWLTSCIFDSARIYDTEILLTVTSYGAEKNLALLQNKDAWSVLGDSLRSLIYKKSAHGIDLDFEQIPQNNIKEFTEFVSSLRSKLGDDKIIALQIPLGAGIGAYDFINLKGKINYFILKGYYDRNEVPLPLAPLKSKNKDHETIESFYSKLLESGLKPDDIILSLPLYGTEWRRDHRQWRKVRDLAYEDIISLHESNSDHFIEGNSMSSLMAPGDKMTSVIWYEGERSLFNKFFWAKKNTLKGVGLWGLGYEGHNPSIWNTVSANFGSDKVIQIDPSMIDNGKVYTFIFLIQKYRKALGMGLFIIIFFFIIGLFLSLLDWRVREIFFRNFSEGLFFNIFIIILVIFASYLLIGEEGGIRQSGMPFLWGILLGGSLIYILAKLMIINQKKRP